jgi:thioesterase domain-containing protein
VSRHPAEAAAATGARPDPACLVSLQRGWSRYPLFCIHDVAGLAGVYRQFAVALGAAYTVFGLQAFWITGRRQPLQSVEAMARHYVEQINTVQPDGPCFLYGWSSGGLVAFEMARLIRARGRAVGVVALGDTRCPDGAREPAADIERQQWLGYSRVALGRSLPGLDATDHPFWEMDEAQRCSFLLDAARRAENRYFLALAALYGVRHHFAVYAGLRAAARAFLPRHYPGPVVVFRARRGPHPAAVDAWSLRSDACRVLDVDGDHVSMMLIPVVEAVAHELRRHLAR